MHAVQRLGRQPAGGEEARLEGSLLRLDASVSEQGLLGGIDDDHAFIAVDDHVVAVVHPGGEVAHADYGRDLERARDDHRMTRLAA